MKVSIQYYDDSSLSIEEIVRQAEHNYGKQVKVVASPDSSAPHDLIYFAVHQILTHRQLQLLFNDRHKYQQEIGAMRKDLITTIAEIIDDVIITNEAKVS